MSELSQEELDALTDKERVRYYACRISLERNEYPLRNPLYESQITHLKTIAGLRMENERMEKSISHYEQDFLNH